MCVCVWCGACVFLVAVEGEEESLSGAGFKEVEDSTLAVEPEADNKASLASPNKSCSIYMETVKFLLQNNALQVTV